MTTADASGPQLPGPSDGRWAWAEVDLAAVRHNVRLVRHLVDPAEVWAVVKADAYGHGAVEVATAALQAGATGLCVALVGEGAQLRAAGIDAPVLVLSEQPPEQLPVLVQLGLTATVYRAETVAALAAAAQSLGARDVPVHVKVDTGMQRVGAAPTAVASLVAAVRAAAPTLRLDGVSTHLATADEPDHPAVGEQLARWSSVVAELSTSADSVRLHVANSAAALSLPTTRHSLVRLGIAMYGICPGPGVASQCADLRPALALKARVSMVKSVAAGSGISYGLRHTFATPTTVATVPIGYADGVPRRLSATGGELLVGGRRCPIVGVVTMDQLMVDVGSDAEVAVGDEVVLLGSQVAPDGTRVAITAEEWAERLDTIGYEIVCGISRRIARRYRG